MARNSLFQIGFSLALAVCSAQFVQAGFVPGFTGNSQMEHNIGGIDQPGSDGLVNFAVWDTSTGTTGNWIFDFLTDYGVSFTELAIIPGVSGFEPYVYLYQMVNTDPLPAAESALSLLQVEAGTFTAGGYLNMGATGVGFNEAAGVTGPVGNPAIGAATTDPVPGNQIPGALGALSAVPFAILPGSETPTSVNNLASESLYQFDFPDLSVFPPLTDHRVLPNGFSTIVVLTANLAPTYLTGTIHDGKTTQGDIPSNTPEPGTFLMTLGALSCGIAVVLSAAKKSRKSV